MGSGSGTAATLSDGTNTYTGTIATDGSITFAIGGQTVAVAAPAGTLADDTVTFTLTSTDTNYTFADTATLTVTASSGATDTVSLAIDFGDITTTNKDYTINADANGYAAGTLSSISFESDGTIIGTYSNGQTQSLGQIALAIFSNAEGLEKAGNNLYKVSANSGKAQYYAAGAGGTSSLTSGALEMSNVDLAAEFSNMMISQRAYQANSKVISTADEMLQSLINMAG